MTEEEFIIVKKKMYNTAVDVVRLSNIGFVISDKDICSINAMFILLNMDFFIEEGLNERQKQKLIEMFNELIII